MTRHLQQLATAIAENEIGNVVMEQQGTELQDIKYGMVQIQKQLLASKQTQQKMGTAMQQNCAPPMMQMPIQ